MRHAIYMARHGDLTEAIARLFEHFRGKFNRSPLAAEALLRAGVLSAAPKVNNFKQARNWFAHLSQNHPGTQEALAADFYSATLAWRARDWSEAEKLHKAFAAKYPDSPLALVALDERLPVIAKKSLAVPQAGGIDRENTVFVEPGSRKRSAFPIIKETAYNACLNISSKWEMAKSEIIDEDSRRGTILWTGPEIVSATLHRYYLSNAYSGEEYVMVQGSFKTPTGGGGQGGVSIAPFRVTVPSVDVDWVGFEKVGDEVQEETRFVIVPANTNKLDDIRRLLLRDPYDDDERLGDRKKKRPTFAHPSRVNPNITLTWNATDAFFLVDGKEVVHSNTIAINGRSIDDKEWPLKYRLELAEPPLPRLSFTITVEGEQTQDGKAIDTIHGRIVNVDLDVDADYNGTINDADEPLEETQGGIVCLSTNSLTPINLKIEPKLNALPGIATLSATAGGNRIRLWQNANRTGPIALPMEWKNGAPVPQTLYVEGVTNSAAASDVALRLEYDENPVGQNNQLFKCADIIKLTVMGVDLDVDANYDGKIDGADEPLEENPGGNVCVGTNNVTPINLKVEPTGQPGKVTLSAIEGGSRIRLWQNANRTEPITLPMEWKNGAPIPQTLYVEGITNSAAACDVGLKLEYDENPAGQSSPLFKCKDIIKLTVLKVEVTNIKFNHNTASSADDALNIRQDYNTAFDISNGEWINGVTNIPVCYTTNKTVTIKARFTVQPADVANAVIWADSIGAGGSLGDVIRTNVTFAGGVSNPEYVTFQVSGNTPNCIQKTTNDAWQWKMGSVNGSGSVGYDLNVSGTHTVYTILNEPATPWVNTAGSQKNAWTVVLEYACLWAATANDEENIVAKITADAYSGFGKTYDGSQSHTYGNHCNLSIMLSDSVVDCRDMSAVVQLFTRLLGGTTVQVRRVDGPFYFKPILPTGSSTWASGGWNFHQFGWHASAVNDACVKLKESAPYIPIHDDLNGSYRTNLFDVGVWSLLAPHTITSFD